MTDSIVTTLPYSKASGVQYKADIALAQPTTYYYLDINAEFSNNSKDILVKDKEAVDLQISNIIDTLQGSEWFEPDYGSLIPRLVFSNITDGTAYKIKTFLLTALSNWMADRITIDHRNTGVIPNLSYPGYDLYVSYKINYNGVPNLFKGKLRA